MNEYGHKIRKVRAQLNHKTSSKIPKRAQRYKQESSANEEYDGDGDEDSNDQNIIQDSKERSMKMSMKMHRGLMRKDTEGETERKMMGHDTESLQTAR